MYTFCPECHAVFHVDAAQLHVARGLMHCGECHQVFNGVDYLYAELPAAREALGDWLAGKGKAGHDERVYATAPVETAGPAGKEETVGEIESAGKEKTDHEAEPDGEREVMSQDSDDWGGPAAARPLMRPIFSDTGAWQAPKLPWKEIAKGGSILVLLVLFAVQWVYFKRNELAADAAWRPALEQLCTILRCDLPLRVDVARIELLNRDVRQHPLVEDALLINATLVNRAAFIQPFPIFEISFSDLAGNPIAMRRFQPGEYVAEELVEPGMPPNAPVQVVLEILDPGDSAVSFQFEFL